MNPEYADLADLEQWANRVSSRQHLPGLLRRLILATVGADRFRAPAGEAVGEPGWDIVLDAPVGHEPWIPAGASRWEGGVGEPLGKAQGDFAKRTKQTPLVVQREQTFVFFTPRRWNGNEAQDWVDRKRAETTNAWADVRVVDGVLLETWLETQPAVHIWASELIGKRPTEVQALTDRWERWSAETAPPLPERLLLAGRQAAVAELTAKVSGPAVELRFGADTVAEALAFFAVAMPDALRPRAVVVNGPAAWLRLASHAGPLILLPTFDEPDVQAALAAGHHVLVPEGPRSARRLPRLDEVEAAAAFEAAGVDPRTASGYARGARRSLSGLRRRLGPRRVPEWADAALLAPALLAGSWVEANAADVEVLRALTGTDWRTLSRELQRYVHGEDPPLRVQSGRWEFLDTVDAWDVLGRAVTRPDLAAFHDLLTSVVAEPDPVRDLPPEQRQYAPLHGVRRTHSGALRKGLVATAAALGAVVGETELQDGRTGQEHANAAVRTLLASDDPRRWLELADVLPDLAEAAPALFLQAVERALAAPGRPLAALLDPEAGDNGLMGARSRHYYLLWALEHLALSPTYASRALLATAGFAELDTGQREGNSPLGSLVGSLHLHRPQAALTRATRRDALDLLRAAHPDLAWPVLVALVPSSAGGGYVHLRSKAHWRDWQPTPADHDLPDVVDALDDVVERLVADVGSDPGRLGDLAEKVMSVPSHARAAVIEALRAGATDPATRRAVAAMLAEKLAAHRAHPTATWAAPEEELAAVQALALALDPNALAVPEVSWFSFWPERRLRGSVPEDEVDAVVERERRAAVQRALDSGGVAAVLELAAASEAAYAVGVHLAAVGVGDDEAAVLARTPDDGGAGQAARAYVDRRFADGGTAWLRQVPALPEPASAAVLRVCPPTPEVLAVVDDVSPAVQDGYWTAPPWRGVDDAHLPEYVERLLARDRPWTALAVMVEHRDEDALPAGRAELALRALEAVRTTQEDGTGVLTGLTYHLARLLDQLDAAGVDGDRLAMMEFWLQPVMQHVRHPTALFRQLRQSPELFVELVIGAYRPDDPQDEDEDDGGDGALAVAMYELLRDWDGLPTVGVPLPDPEALLAWVVRAHDLLGAAGRETIGWYCLGRALAGRVKDEDGTWPSVPVRHVLETLAQPALEEGLFSARLNQRGITSRGVYSGGDLERQEAQPYEEWAGRVRSRCPRTAALLDELAAYYRAESREQDDRRERR